MARRRHRHHNPVTHYIEMLDGQKHLGATVTGYSKSGKTVKFTCDGVNYEERMSKVKSMVEEQH